MRFLIKKAWRLFFLGSSLVFLFQKEIFSKQTAYWKVHYEQLKAAKKYSDTCVLDDTVENVSQFKIKNEQDETLYVVTQRDRMNIFVKTLITIEGTVLACIEYCFTAESCCYIKMFYAFKKEHGYGTLLLRILLKELKIQGYSRIELHSIPEAEQFYVKHGFEYAKQYVSPNFFPHLVVMTKNI